MAPPPGSWTWPRTPPPARTGQVGTGRKAVLSEDVLVAVAARAEALVAQDWALVDGQLTRTS